MGDMEKASNAQSRPAPENGRRPNELPLEEPSPAYTKASKNDDGYKKSVLEAAAAAASETQSHFQHHGTTNQYAQPELQEMQAYDVSPQNIAPPQLPWWLKNNLRVAKITVFVMFFVSAVHFAFASIIKDDLADDPNDFTCDYRYIKDAAEPWPDPDGRIVLTWPAGSGRYHGQCRRILAASRVLDAAAAFTIFRPFLQMLPVFAQTFWTVRYEPNGWLDRHISPSRVYSARAVFSLVPSALYLACAAATASTRLVAGAPRADGDYRDMFAAEVAVQVLSAAACLHQAAAAGAAAWYLRGWKQMRRIAAASRGFS
ncbi:hypothetical protein N3K66_005169 [Trichothecium roseum]|uniref:Uncharacterized protein n=1 Tax=Trichothecium roseum TaxID=47278 RepID=A0ACC0V3F5_9HYPO|nr:hypothetical protein N3K66_005169 [Trichothecium roseum]